MSSFLKIDQRNLVENGLNNTFRYEFIGSAANLLNHEIAIQSISMYNSQFNVDATAFGNNTFSIIVPTAATTSTINITLSDGYYSYTDINREIQSALLSAGAYLVDADSNNVFYIQLIENSVYYSAQLDFSPTPTSLPTNFTRPATGLYSTTGTGLPTTTLTPRIEINNAAFGSLLGLTTGTYPASPSTSATYQLSNTTPEIHPSSSYVVRCDVVDNKFDPLGNILTAFDRSGATLGEIIRYQPTQSIWVSCHNGPRTSINVSIFDQDDRPVHFRDRSVALMLVIRQKPLYG